MDALFHIVEPVLWETAAAEGTYQPKSLVTEGFVHCSFAGQVAGSANRHFAAADHLCVVELDPARIRAEIRVENGFPHVYGPIPTEAAAAVHHIDRDERGHWRFSYSGEGGAASRDR